MPFTFSHPAIIIPVLWINKRYFSLTGLIAGSIVPDFEYFLKMKKGASTWSHTLPGIFYFNLPLALLLACIFHGIVKKPMVAHAPGWLLKRMEPFKEFRWAVYLSRHWLVVIISILLACLSHLLWDGLTHISADYFYHHQHQLFAFSSWQHHSIIYSAVHSVHSLIGLLILAIAFFKLEANTQAKGSAGWYRYWISIFLVTVCVFCIRVAVGGQLEAGDLAVSLIAIALLAVVVISLLYKVVPNFLSKR